MGTDPTPEINKKKIVVFLHFLFLLHKKGLRTTQIYTNNLIFIKQLACKSIAMTRSEEWEKNTRKKT